ncbi:wax ester/triacylglycerol synthase domain-containing protein [Streptomyces ziwulingensis]|uniref:Wax ester/triacylglycerol synthase family O-acyltransferase n=1 Tax=Streptomyces ziwulingensis TaxID=1045501 RepID=A0ABP9CW19_9ACTN
MRLTRPRSGTGADGHAATGVAIDADAGLPATLRMGTVDVAYRLAAGGRPLPVPFVFAFDGPAPALDAVHARVAERVHAIPALRYRPARDSPVFRRIDHVAVERHVHEVHLPGPIDGTGLGRLLLSRPLETGDGPLWEVLLVHGAAGGHALCYRTDHTAQDGVGAAHAARALLDDDPGNGPPAQGGARPALAGLAGVLGDVATGFGPARAKPGFDGPVGGLAAVRHAHTTLARLRALGRAHGGSVNDVYLAALSHAVRTWHLKATGTVHPPLPVVVPMSVRAPGEEGYPGNRMVTARVLLPCDEESPRRALGRVAASTGRLRDGRRRDAFRLLLAATPRALGARIGLRLVNGRVVACPASSVNFGGPLVHRGVASRWSAVYSGLASGIRCMVTMTCQGDAACLSVVHDENLTSADALPDLWLAALEELERG